MKLEAREITKKFGEQVALDHVDLTIENGEFFGLLGTNGAGKTTMIRILSTLMLPTFGTVLADGQELTRNNVDMKKKITVMTQEYTLRNDMSIEEILEYQGRLYHVPRQERKERAVELMKLTGLYEHRNKLIRHLSGGMKRKLMICRALLTEPEILLLDEPTAGMDALSRRQMWNLLRKLNGNNMTIILTTHYIEEAQALCDRVALINRGVLRKLDTPQALIKELGEYAVDETNEETLLTRYFHDREEAIEYLKKAGVPINEAQWKISEDIFMTQIRAMVGRYSKLEDEAFYPIIADIDNVIQRVK